MMITTVTLCMEPSADRTLCIPLPPDVPQGPLEVVVVIAPFQPAPPVSNLAGRWQAYFPPDFDIDSALQEIRHEWEQEWTEAKT
jgi:hypothetical protein